MMLRQLMLVMMLVTMMLHYDYGDIDDGSVAEDVSDDVGDDVAT